MGTGRYTAASVDALLGAAAADPAGFRLLFHHAAREPEFREDVDRLRAAMVTVTQRELARAIPDGRWATWAAYLVPVVAIEAVTAWLDAGQPDPAAAADRIRDAVHGIIQAAQPRQPP